jgi:KDO2-lipid IV(A) lauroyltransferase
MSEWVLQNFVARGPTNFFALGLLEPKRSAAGKDRLTLAAQAAATLPRSGVWLSGWELLGQSIFGRVRTNFLPVLVPMIVLSILSLCLAFRRLSEVLLSVAVLALSGLCLLAVMRLAGWSWNLLNLMGIPLILGTGIDYGIFMQLALKRFGGDQAMAHRSVGRALLLCGSTATAGFGALGLSSNAGMASLGQVCAVGIASNMLISIYLLPAWWSKLATSPIRLSGETGSEKAVGVGSPSSLYRSELWVLGVKLVRILPYWLCKHLTSFLVAVYWHAAKHRREVVTQNLLPVFWGDLPASRQAARNLYRNFAIKLLDLWRYEGGMSVQHLLGTYTGWENMVEAANQKRGVLILTPHLGNWEFGGPWLTQRGVDLHVITLEEPGEGLTSFRREARARWQIKTVVIGNDLFGFVQIIRLLESGATIALLMDRPLPPSSTLVQLFGQPFPASVAAAELARASGCALLPVYVVREGQSYTAHILPQITYERATLRDRATRQALTQKIMTAFEPVIQQHPDQWYHFVPVWPKAGAKAASPRTEAGQTPPG